MTTLEAVIKILDVLVWPVFWLVFLYIIAKH